MPQTVYLLKCPRTRICTLVVVGSPRDFNVAILNAHVAIVGHMMERLLLVDVISKPLANSSVHKLMSKVVTTESGSIHYQLGSQKTLLFDGACQIRSTKLGSASLAVLN